GEALPREIPVGEVALGRSEACNIVAESRTVSKLHARLERTSDQLVLQDLDSANGTFVNVARVQTAVLRNGDVISLAGVETYTVVTEVGEVTLASGTRYPVVPPDASRPRFSAGWKTRFEWESGEREVIAALQRQFAERPLGKTPARPEPVQ